MPASIVRFFLGKLGWIGLLGLLSIGTARATPETMSASGQDAVAGSVITLTGRATDPEGRLAHLAFYITGPGYPGWNHVGTVDLSGSDSTGSMPWPSPATAGGFAVHVRAFNDAWEADWNGNIVAGFTLNAPNSSPQTNWVAGTDALQGDPVTFTANATDPDGNLQWLHFYVTGPGMPGWNHVGSAQVGGGDATGSISWSTNQPGSYAVHVRAQDDWGWYDWNGNQVAGFTISAPVNNAPTTSLTMNGSTSPISIAFGQTASLVSTMNDPDGNLYLHTFWWDQGNGSYWTNVDHWWNYAPSSAGWSVFAGAMWVLPAASQWTNTITANFRPESAGSFAFLAGGYDAQGAWNDWGLAGMARTLTVNKCTPQVGFAGQTLTGPATLTAAHLNASFANPYSSAVAPPNGAINYVITGGGSGTLIPGSVLAPGVYQVTAQYVGNANYNPASAAANFTVTSPPVTVSISAPNATVGNSVTITARATDADGNLFYFDLFYSGPNAPPWQHIATVMAATGSGSGYDRTVTYVWTPPGGLSGDYTLHVRAYDTSYTPDANGNVTSGFHIYGANVPPALNFPNSNGSASEATALPVAIGQPMWSEILATDANENMYRYLAEIIRKTPTGDALVIQYWINFGSGGTINRQAPIPGTSSWINLDAIQNPGRDGKWRWNWTFGSAAQPGVYEMRLHYGDTNEQYTGRGSFYNLQPAASAPAITSPLTANGTVGVAFSYQMTASNNPTSFSASGLPPGTVLNTTTGSITGTSTTAGAFAVSLSASNASATGATVTLSLTVSAPPANPPVITSALTANGTVGTAFSYQITASNSPTGFAATNLPAGLTVNAAGLITGTPTTAGTRAVALSATNAAGTGTATLTLAINAAGAPVITSALTTTGAIGTAFSYQITASNTPTGFGASSLPTGLSVNNAGLITGTPTTNGPTVVGLTATNAGGTGVAALTLRVTSPDDTDGDGVPNALEILAGMNPNDPSDGGPANFQKYQYDKASRLINGPGRGYTPDNEGNLK